MKHKLLAALAIALFGCQTTPDEKSKLTLATTTSTRDSGLLDVLVPRFEAAAGIQVKVVAVGSGQALQLGQRGDADVLLTHSPVAEEQFMAEGHGELRRAVMHNDFVLVGPPAEASAAGGQESITVAFRRIAHRGAAFISRGDESGTHAKERQIWQQAGIEPRGDWYIEASAGMAAALRMASEKRAYTLCDRGTFLAQRDRLDLVIICEGDPLLRNQYSVIIVAARRHPEVNRPAAQRWVDFLLSAETQAIIGEFGVDRFGQPLFFAQPRPRPQD
jgi:tungstate transport system substrate-binding protein